MQNLISSKIFQRFSALVMLAGVLVSLTSCGDGGSPASTTTVSGAVAASGVQLLVSNPQMLSSSSASTNLTAIVLDANGQAVSGKVVTFSKGTDASAYFSNVSAISSSNGVATATLNLGTDMSNRTITATATADAAVGTSPITVSGTKIAISGNTSLAQNAQSTLTIIVKDSAGNAVPGITLTVASQNSNPITLSPSTGVTSATGQITATVTATNAGTGTDVLTVTGAGATQTQTLTINTADFTFTAPVTVAPATTPEIVVGVATSVTVRWLAAGAPVNGSTVSFSTSRGSFAAATAVTNATGDATLNVTATSTGATIFTVTGPLGTPAATLNVVFITTTASTINAQASPSTVAINASGGLGNQSVISVVVRDAAKNLVKNAHVNFSIAADPSGGSLASASATTDITGTASVNYIAGSTSSSQNGVQITATVDMVNGAAITPISTSVNLTVAAQALYVRLGSDNTVYSDIAVAGTYTKKYTALVTDSAGNSVPDGTPVTFVLRPAKLTTWSFAKGYYEWLTGAKFWTQHPPVMGCVNEDTNLNGVKDAGEDLNGNGINDPGGVATVTPTATTVSGFATANISYAKDYAFWVQFDLEARAGVSSNDPPTVVTVVLPGAAKDYTDQAIPPPGASSPYGVGLSCADML